MKNPPDVSIPGEIQFESESVFILPYWVGMLIGVGAAILAGQVVGRFALRYLATINRVKL